MTQNDGTKRAKLLSLREIAAWQLPELASIDKGAAALPALQRGAVWKPHQVECLWDSLVRGFPIGSFLLAPFEVERGQQRFKYQQSTALSCPAEYHLLDGQQRANAIALGFLDPWTSAQFQVPAVLWVDIAPPPESHDARFVFRVLTTSHPWGYRRDHAAYRIRNDQMRAAMAAFCRLSSGDLQGKRPAQVPLRYAWPHDADAPIPLWLLLKAIDVSPSDPAPSLQQALKQVPLWNAAISAGFPWAKNVVAALDGTERRLATHLSELCRGLSAALEESVPALVLRATTERREVAPSTDPVETLFIRVNTAGTKLDGEELIYSVLKSAWPEAQQCVEELQFRMIPAPRVVLLATRLVQASSPEYGKSPPPAPNVAGFRKLLHDAEFRDLLRRFMRERDRGPRVFSSAKSLLECGEFGLPAVLSCGIARSRPDVLFLLLRWIDRMLTAGIDPCVLDDISRRRIVGTITALAWFAVDAGQCVGLLWERLQSCPAGELGNFFSRSTFNLTLRLGSDDSLCMLPLVPPDLLSCFIADRVTESPDLLDPAGSCWTAWNWGERMQPETLPECTLQWYRSSFAGVWSRPPREDGSEFDLSATGSRAWRDLIGRLGDWRRRNDLLLYAQREWIRTCFPDYDPSLPDQMEDINCPWDYDHIHPQSYVAGRWYMPQIIKDWHGTMGNFRAWPFDINRSDHDVSPRTKFEIVGDLESERYSLHSPADKRRFSFIADDAEWGFWREATPPEPFDGRYLGRDEHAGCRRALIRAVSSRFVRIYREWYRSLCIHDLITGA